MRQTGLETTPSGRSRRWASPLVLAAALASLALLTYLPALRNGFVMFDDGEYVIENVRVRQGLSPETIAWVWRARVASHWHPLTLLSHLADVSLWGLRPAGHHLTSLLLHAATTVLLFAALLRLTGERLASAWVAAVFAAHPTHVEAVAWIADRKDVLSAVFWTAGLLAWVGWVRERRVARYLAVATCLVLALLAKATAVTLPLVLLIVDVWPLRRLGGGERPAESPRRLLLEKVPLLVLAAVSGAVAVLSAERTRLGEEFGLGRRLATATVATFDALAASFAPVRLAVLYPLREIPPWELAAKAAVLVAVTAAAFALRRRAPAMLAGWTWFLVVIAPVSGLVQSGPQLGADRYTYLSQTGLAVAVAFGALALAGRRADARRALGLAGLAVLVPLIVLTRLQIATWRDTETLFAHAARVTERNAVAHLNLGVALMARGADAEAMRELATASRLAPDLALPHAAIGELLRRRGRPDLAVPALRRARVLDPTDLEVGRSLAAALDDLGHTAEALREIEALVRLRPDDPRLAAALAELRSRGGGPAHPVPAP